MLSQPHSQQKDHNLAGIKNFCCKFSYLIGLCQVLEIEFLFNDRKTIKPHVYIFIFYSEIDNFDTGLLIEVWDKGMLWDKTIGYFWEPLQKILQCAELVCCTSVKKISSVLNPISYHGRVSDGKSIKIIIEERFKYFQFL